jgi:hypothetical protein
MWPSAWAKKALTQPRPSKIVAQAKKVARVKILVQAKNLAQPKNELN